jgi:flagellar biosynthesis protein FliR
MMTILLMAASPLWEIVDRWDNIPATGNDTALTLIVIGACIGLCFAMASLLVWRAGFVFSLVMRLSTEMTFASQPHPQTLEYERLLFSPPLSLTFLRI